MNQSTLLSQIAGHAEALAYIPTARPLDHKRLNAVLCAVHTLSESGMPWRCADKDERSELAELARLGLVEINGRTQGQTVRLLPAGVLAAWTKRFSIEPKHVVELVGEVKAAPTVRAPWGDQVVMGFELVESAGKWWRRPADSPPDSWAIYCADLDALGTILLPAIILGWLYIYVATRQQIWALTTTDREPKLPQTVPDVGIDKAAWDKAYDRAVEKYTTHPPDPGRYIAHLLPASQWV